MATTGTLWREIANSIERKIKLKELRSGDKLPTEWELSREFMVNRHTVRRALAHLQERGLVESTQGRGSFVQRLSRPSQLSRRPRFTESVRQSGREPSTRTLKLDVRPAEPKVAHELELNPGKPIIFLERLLLIDGEPTGLGAHCFSYERFPTFIEMYRDRGSITRTLADCGVPDYTRKQTVIAARLPTQREAELLHLPRHVSLVIRRSLNVDTVGRPLEYAESSGTTEVVVDFPFIING